MPTISDVIEKLEILDLDMVRKKFPDNIIHILTFEVDEVLAMLKSIKWVDDDETCACSDCRKKLNRRIFGEG